MILGIHHAQITIPTGKEDEARAFYCGVLGLKEVGKPNELKDRGGFWILAGRQAVHVGTEDGEFDRNQTKAHLAYAVDDLKTYRIKLEAEGCKILKSIPIPGVDRFETRDPFGNRLEFVQVQVQPRQRVQQVQPSNMHRRRTD